MPGSPGDAHSLLHETAAIMSAERQADQRQPNCLICRHYYVTHDPRQPRGCKAYGFKSRDLPALVVRSVSGKPCLLFTAR